ncbi:DUF3618 domain-containing protein [Thermobifida halotolerans]|uniref:DUF3618 domain-containing protein n=1 Tax=Thermobifida halotolerans TaxID=483545 RepID=UPI00351314D2
MQGRDPASPQRDPAAVQAEIEQVQQRLAASIDALADRANPKNAARRGLDRGASGRWPLGRGGARAAGRRPGAPRQQPTGPAR